MPAPPTIAGTVVPGKRSLGGFPRVTVFFPFSQGPVPGPKIYAHLPWGDAPWANCPGAAVPGTIALGRPIALGQLSLGQLPWDLGFLCCGMGYPWDSGPWDKGFLALWDLFPTLSIFSVLDRVFLRSFSYLAPGFCFPFCWPILLRSLIFT